MSVSLVLPVLYIHHVISVGFIQKLFVRFGSKADINASAKKGPLSGVKRT
jgi:hypothetical protein